MPRTRIKFCGVMSVVDARDAAAIGADAVGMILHADARRKIDLPTAAAIIAALPPLVTPVGVFVDAPPQRVREIAAGLGLSHVQFHGGETADDVAAAAPLRVIKAIKTDPLTIRATLDAWRAAFVAGRIGNLTALLLEAPAIAAGGTGQENDFALIERLQHEGVFTDLPPVIIAGGLRPGNVRAIVSRLRPFAVDVSSGIEETFGQKSRALMQRFADETTTR